MAFNKGKMSCCFSLTWSAFTNRDTILNELIANKLITKTLLVIEAHQMIGTGVSKEDGVEYTDTNEINL